MRKAVEVAGRTADAEALQWLLEDDQPVARYYALTELLGQLADDADVRSTRSKIPRIGWAHDLLRTQHAKGFWEPREPKNIGEWVEFLYNPPFQSTNWKALVLSDFGLDATHSGIKKVADLLFDFKLRLSSPFNFYHEEACIAANTARMMVRFGYGEDRRIGWLYDWLLEDQREDGGWNCSQGTPGTLDVWEPLAAFAALPKAKRSTKMEAAIARGGEFYLQRRLFQEGRPYAPWLRLHYPNHYFYDILVGLDVLTRLGFAADRRLDPALRLLEAKRRRDGSWIMDRVHPDLGRGYTVNPDPKRIKPLVIEPAGKPSKWITLQAMRVRKRVADAR